MILNKLQSFFQAVPANSRQNDFIITGIPRSGSTLVCHLLNQLPQTIALHEPLRFRKFTHVDQAVNRTSEIFGQMRKSLLKDKTAFSRQERGVIPDNHYDDGTQGARQLTVTKGMARFDKALSPDFLLAIKHCSPFTLLLQELRKRYTCFAVIRNPLAILASWNTLEISVSRGSIHCAEIFNPDLAERLSKITDVYDRQFFILAWFFEQYLKLPASQILRYEETVATAGKSLSVITPRAGQLDRPLADKNDNQLYPRSLLEKLGTKLLQSDGAYWQFYSKESVELLLAAL